MERDGRNNPLSNRRGVERLSESESKAPLFKRLHSTPSTRSTPVYFKHFQLSFCLAVAEEKTEIESVTRNFSREFQSRDNNNDDRNFCS